MKESFLARLAAVIQDNPSMRKTVVARSFAEGHMWLERVARTRGPVLNVSVATPESLAADRARGAMAERNVRLIGREEQFWLVLRLMREMSADPEAWVPADMLGPGVVRAVTGALDDLRHAGMTAEDVREAAFTDPRKGRYVKRLLAAYERALETGGLTDGAGAALMAEPDGMPTVYIRHALLPLAAVQRNMLNRLGSAGGNRLAVLEADPPFTEGGMAAECRFFRGTGPLSEVQEAFRRLAEWGAAWDEVEWIAADYGRHAPVIHAIAEKEGIACTFTQGLPVEFAIQGRVARLFLEWVHGDYRVDVLVTGLRHGWIRPEGVSASAAARLLEQSGVGWGRERYEAWAEKLLRPDEPGVSGPPPGPADVPTLKGEALDAALETDGDNVSVAGPEAGDAAPGGREGKNGEVDRRDDMRAFGRWVKGLFRDLPAGGRISPAVLLRALSRFLREHAAAPDEFERALQNRIREAAEAAANLDDGSVMDREMAIRCVADQLGGLSCRVSPLPEPGAMLVAGLADGGTSGRKYTVFLGMEEDVWAPRAIQDPVLLDEERAALSSDLKTSAQLAADRQKERDSRLSMAEGVCLFGYTSYDVASGQEKHPAYELLQVFRHKAGRPEADFDALSAAAGPVCGFDPAGLFSGTRDGFPALEAGEAADAARRGPALTAWDGMVDAGGKPVLEPDKPLSVTRLEQYGACGLKFFYRTVLGIKPKEIAAFDRTRWLDPLQRGSLLHDIYCRYYQEMQRRYGPGMPLVHDKSLLDALTEQAIRQWTEAVPAPSPAVHRRECRQIRRDVDVFFLVEQERTERVPLQVEFPIHDGDAPFETVLADDVRIFLRGFVDRIDAVEPHRYRIIDYKTGRSDGYRDNDAFAGGTQLQHALYAAAVEQKFRRDGTDPAAEVAVSSYRFPTEKGLGEEAERRRDPEKLAALLRNMLGAINAGMFPPTDDPGMCAWCDYRDACGAHAEWMKEKLSADDNARKLAPVLEVRGHA